VFWHTIKDQAVVEDTVVGVHLILHEKDKLMPWDLQAASQWMEDIAILDYPNDSHSYIDPESNASIHSNTCNAGDS
jgi:hypothetical protein